METAVRAAETTPAMLEPVTVVVTRHVRPGHEADYEQWLRCINHEATAFTGCLASTSISCRWPSARWVYPRTAPTHT